MPTTFRNKCIVCAVYFLVTSIFLYQQPSIFVLQSISNNLSKHEELFRIRINYFYQAWKDQDSLMAKRAKELEPFQVLTEYIEKHSNDQLEQEWFDCVRQNREKGNSTTDSIRLMESDSCNALKQRKFIVGMYSCPQEAGNRLHRFMNALLWAVLTNRTFLYRYHTYDSCVEYNEGQGACEAMLDSYPSDCHGILHLSPWVPSYDVWRERLLLHEPIERAQIHTKGQGEEADNNTRPYDNPDLSRVIRTGYQFKPNPGNILLAEGGISTHLSLSSNQQRLVRLQSLGVYFVYGMLFESLFTIDQSLLPDTSSIDERRSPAVAQQETYALHSRHPSDSLKGDYIWPERLCILELFENSTLPCLIYLMSDRPLALEMLTETIRNTTNCHIETVTNRTSGTSFRSEHGPFSGVGYWQDLAMASQARHGIIAFHQSPRLFLRTSTSLIRERIEFRRVLEQWEGEELPEFRECSFPRAWMKR